MSVAQKCVKACGPNTRQLLKAANHTTTWNGYLVKNLIGRNRTIFSQYRNNYNGLGGVGMAGWETAATKLGSD
jgi:hypothetical protein